MKIRWFGQACFSITSENGTKIVTDPFDKTIGYNVPELDADIVSTSHDHFDHNNINAVKGLFVHIDKPGSFSEKGIEIKGIPSFHDNTMGAKRGKNTIYCFKIDEINVCHCGDLGHILNSSQVEQIGDVDILLIPVGGFYTINSSDALKVVNQLNPTVVIPMHYRTKALGLKGHVFEKVDKFTTASGLNAKEYAELTINRDNIKDYAGIALLKYE